MRTSRPAARPAHAFHQFSAYPFDMRLAGFRLLDRGGPANPFVPRKRSNVFPCRMRLWRCHKRLSQIRRYRMQRPGRESFSAHAFMITNGLSGALPPTAARALCRRAEERKLWHFPGFRCGIHAQRRPPRRRSARTLCVRWHKRHACSSARARPPCKREHLPARILGSPQATVSDGPRNRADVQRFVRAGHFDSLARIGHVCLCTDCAGHRGHREKYLMPYFHVPFLFAGKWPKSPAAAVDFLRT